MSGTIVVPQDLGPYPPEARARVTALQQDLDVALREGDLLQARGIRQSLNILAIWFPPGEALEVRA